VAFRCSGLPDAVEDRSTGYLAEPYDCADLAAGIRWVTENAERLARLRESSAYRAARLWQKDVVAQKNLDQYAKAMAAHPDVVPSSR
jgi:glycosyltransferase involved in cell wall biosynthesis